MAAEGAAARAVVLCADDYAVNEAASRGIVQLAQAGRLSATSAMVLSPRWREDAALLKPLAKRIDVGLHLDFTSEFAGMPLGAAMRRALLGGFDPEWASRAIEAQLEAFEMGWGAPPDHIDGHQHVQQFKGVREALVKLVTQRYPAGRKPWLRISDAVGGGAKGLVIRMMGARALREAARRAGVPCSGPLLGLYGFDGDEAGYAQRLQQWLRDAPAGAVIMCHPAATSLPGDEIGAARLREFNVLKTARFDGVRLARGSELFA